MSRRTRYFNKFPITDYNGVPSINIMKRAALNENVKNFLSAFYTYTMEDQDNIDNLAYNYYDDVDYDWLLYHANDIIDPYYQVVLPLDLLEDFIKDKYGSLRDAKRKVKNYKNNYKSDDSIISTSGYNALDGDLRKYWQPVYGALGIAGYERAKIDYTVSTNKIMAMDFTANVETKFTKDEVVVRDDDSSAIAQISWSGTSNVVIQHVRGTFTSNTNYSITGESSGVTATVNADSVSTLRTVIPDAEQVYYSPVFCYDDEEEKNEDRREIYLIDKGYRQKINKQLNQILR